MRWPRLPCCCGALLSWSATTRRAQQRPHRCNFGELDKLHFLKKEISQNRGFLCFNAWTGLCACVRVCSAVGLLSLSLSVCLRAADRGFSEPSMSAFEVPCWWRHGSRASASGSPLCQSDENETPVRFCFLKITLQIYLAKVCIGDNAPPPLHPRLRATWAQFYHVCPDVITEKVYIFFLAGSVCLQSPWQWDLRTQ